MALVRLLLADLARLPKDTVAAVVLTLNLRTESWDAPAMPWPVHVTHNPQPLGFGANHNRAFERARALLGNDSPFAFAVVNPDIGLPSDPFPQLLVALQAPRCGLAAPWVVNPQGQGEDAWRATLTPWGLIGRVRAKCARLLSSSRPRDPQAPHGSGQHAIIADTSPQPVTPDWAAGMFLLFSSVAYQEVGGFDEGYFMYCEDMDVCLRLRAAGWGLRFVRSAQVVHDARRASAVNLRHLAWHVQSLWRFWQSPAYRARAQLAPTAAPV